jgi:hypothetical protein
VTALNAIHRDRNTNLKKASWYKTVDASSGAYSVQTVIDKKEHSFRRRVLASAFSDSALRKQEQYVDYNVKIFLEQIGKDVQENGWTKPLDFSVWTTYFGFDFISDLSFGSRFRLLEATDFRYMPDLLKWVSHFLYYVGSNTHSPRSRPHRQTYTFTNSPFHTGRLSPLRSTAAPHNGHLGHELPP